MLIFIVAFFSSLLLSFGLTPLVKKCAFLVGAIDLPEERKVHKNVMPRLGGVAIYTSYALSYITLVYFTDYVATSLGYAILFGGFIVLVTGIIDDIKGLNARPKLVGQILAACVPVFFGLTIDDFTLPFFNMQVELGYFGIPVTIFWILSITNAINLIDGLDGLASGVSSIAYLTLFVISLMIGNDMTALMTLTLAGSSIGFLYFNFHPAKIFMGDSGSLFLGFALATLSLLELKEATIVSFFIPILMLVVPISDTLFVMIRRKINNQPILVADKSHFHHRLLQIGYSHKQTVLIIYLISSVFAALSILLSQQTSLWITIVIVLFYILFISVLATTIGLIQSKHLSLVPLVKRFRSKFK